MQTTVSKQHDIYFNSTQNNQISITVNRTLFPLMPTTTLVCHMWHKKGTILY